jgi:hypothetical protein
MACNAGARTLNTIYPGRFLLGLGVSHLPLAQRMRGHDYTRPAQTMRDYRTALDAAPYTAWAATSPRPARVLAALAPRMLNTARDRPTAPTRISPIHAVQKLIRSALRYPDDPIVRRFFGLSGDLPHRRLLRGLLGCIAARWNRAVFICARATESGEYFGCELRDGNGACRIMHAARPHRVHGVPIRRRRRFGRTVRVGIRPPTGGGLLLLPTGRDVCRQGPGMYGHIGGYRQPGHAYDGLPRHLALARHSLGRTRHICIRPKIELHRVESRNQPATGDLV